MKTIVINDCDSTIYKVKVTWNSGKSCDVFETVEQAKDFMIARFGKCRFIDKREGGKNR